MEVGQGADRHGDQPFPGRLVLQLGFDDLQYIVDAGYPGQRRQHFLQPFPVHMGVAVDQSRDDGLAAEVDDFRRRSDQPLDGLIGTHHLDPVAGDGDGLFNAEGFVDGNDLAAMQNQ